MRKGKRILSLILALLMCLSVLPTVSFADETAEEPAAVTEAAEQPAESAPEPEEKAPAEAPAEKAPEKKAEPAPAEKEAAPEKQEEPAAAEKDAGEPEPAAEEAGKAEAAPGTEETAAAPEGGSEEVKEASDEAETEKEAADEADAEAPAEDAGEVPPEDAAAEPAEEAADAEAAAGETPVVPETVEEEPAAGPTEVEVEEGVFHGMPEGDLIAKGVYDTDFPVVVSFEIVEDTATLQIGDTVHFKADLKDADGIRSAELRFGTSYNDYWSYSKRVDLTLNEDSGLYEGEYTFSESDTPGEYFGARLQVTDTYGLYTSYQHNARRVMQRLLPGYVNLAGEKPQEEEPEDSEEPDDFAFAEDGQTLSPGDKISFSFTTQKNLTDAYFYARAYANGDGSLRIEEDAFTYDAETGAVTASYTIPETAYNGKYYISSISANGYVDDEWFNEYWSLGYMKYTFTLTGATDKPPVEDIITEITCPENGQTLKDGDTVHISFRVNSEATVSSADVYLRYYKASEWGNTGVNTGIDGSKYLDAVLNEDTGCYEASYTFQEDDLYGVYQIDQIYVYTNQGSYSAEPDMMVLFAKEESESFTRLEKATDLNWTSDGYARFTMPADHLGRFDVYFYKEDGTYITGVGYSSMGSDTSWTAEQGVDEFLDVDEDLETGNYYFTVTLLGDGKNYYDSETVKSPLFAYTAPAEKLPTVTGLKWETYGDGSAQRAKVPAPASGLDHVRGYQLRWYFSETEGKKPTSCGYRSSGWFEEDGFGYDYLWDDILQTYGNGWYYFQVRLVSNDVFAYRNGDWSELSPGYNVGDVADSIATQLKDVVTAGKTADEIREQVQNISTEDLKEAMLTDDSVADRLRELEAAAGSKTVVSSNNVPELASGVKAIGAGLNDIEHSGDVTLVIDSPEREDVLPAQYDNAVAVRFSMDLDNVRDTENLKVPVLIDLPIPEDINPYFLVLLHYHVAGGSPERIYPYTYQAGGKWYAQFAVSSFSDFVLTQTVGTPKPERVQQFTPDKYLTLAEGDTAEVFLYDPYDNFAGAVWYATDANGKPFENEEDAVIAVDEGFVTALKVGTAYAVADVTRYTDDGYWDDEEDEWIPYTKTETVRCRIDVIAAVEDPFASAITQVTLADAKATVELYSTNYTTITLLSEREDLAKTLVDESDRSVPVDNGWALRHVELIGKGAELFQAVVKDDRTIAIVPEYSTLELAQKKSSNVKKSYKFSLRVTMQDDSEYIAKNAKGKDTTLTVTVKQSKPKLKVSSLKFNSAVPNDYQPFNFNPDYVIGLEPDTAAAAKAKKDAVPAWLDYDIYGAWLQDGALEEASGTLYLLATVEGWSVKVPVKVSYSVKSTKPTMTVKPKSVSLRAGTSDYTWLAGTLKPSVFADSERFPITVEIKEGTQTYENGSVLQVELDQWSWESSSAIYGIRVDANRFTDGQAHTYKVNLKIGERIISTFTVNTTVKDVKLSLKQSGYIEGLVWDGGIFLDATAKNYNVYAGAEYETRITMIPKGSKEEVEVPIFSHSYVTDEDVITDEGALFQISYYEGWIDIGKTKEQLPRGTYYAYTTATLGADQNGNEIKTNTVKTKLNIKWTDPAKYKPATIAMKLKQKKGSVIDPVRPGTEASFYLTTNNGKSYWSVGEVGDEQYGFNYTILKKVGKTTTELTREEEPFEVYGTEGDYTDWRPRIVVRMKEGATVESGATYSIKVTKSWSDKPIPVVKIPIKMGTVKMKKVGSIRLFLKDRYSNGEVTLTPTDTRVSAISRIELDSKSKALFDLHEVGNGRYAIGFKNNQVPTSLKSGKSKTVKLSIWFEGNNTSKANVTVSVKVNLF